MIKKIAENRDKARVRRCLECPVCRHARKRQRGLAFSFVKAVEGKVYPYCRAYGRFHGRKAHEPLPRPEKSDHP